MRGNTDSARKGVQAIIDQMDRMNGLVDSLRRLQDDAGGDAKAPWAPDSPASP